MSEIEWVKFFDLMEKIVYLPMPANEKAELVCQKAVEHKAETALGEFAAYALDIP